MQPQILIQLQKQLSSPDVITFEFSALGNKRFYCVYVDGLIDKAQLGELVVKPLKRVPADAPVQNVKYLLASPEVKEGHDLALAASEVSDGNAVLFAEDQPSFFIIGLKNPPSRSVMEPPSQVAIKGPREGFTEDAKTNLALVRKRLKSDQLQVQTLTCGTRSHTQVVLCYLKDVCNEGLPERIKQRIESVAIDYISDSSYVSSLLSGKPRSIFKRCGQNEKPDVFCAKLCEGRVGIIVDGSPIALTVPYLLVEDFQSPEDYYVNSKRATVTRLLRLFAVFVGVLLPAFYVAAQLYKIELIPYKLLRRISGSVENISLSPSIELFLTVLILEVLNEASVRMPKYVGLAMSVVGALVLGDTAVKAGVISTPAIIIVAFSAICLYSVPDLVETTTLLRWLFLLVAGSVGTFGILLTLAYLACYLVSEQDYGTPLLYPLVPSSAQALRDAIYKAELSDLTKRPQVFAPQNQTRLKTKGDSV